MITPNQAGIAAAIRTLRAQLTAMSTGWINYNSMISDEEMLSDVTKVITVYLNTPPSPKGD